MKRHWKKHMGILILTALAGILAAMLTAGLGLALQYAVDEAIVGEVKRAAIGLAGYAVVFGMILWIKKALFVKVNQQTIRDIRSRITASVLHKSCLEFEKHKSAEYLSLVTNDVKKIEEGYLDTTLSILEAVVQFIFAVVILTGYSWVFTAVMIGMCILMLIVPSIMSGCLKKVTAKLSEEQANFTNGMKEVLDGYEVIRAYGQSKRSMNKFEIFNKRLYRSAKRYGFAKEANEEISVMLGLLMQVVICLLAGWFICQNRMSYGSMLGVIQVSGSITSPLFALFGLLPMLMSFQPILEKIEEYCGDTEDNSIGDEARIECTEEELVPKMTAWQKIDFDNICFAYADTEKEVLKEISFSIEKGKKYLITGESGAGKSTLIKLLCGSYLSDRGTIQIDGNRIKKPEEWLQKMTAVIHQDVFLFNESIRDNITFAKMNEMRLQRVIDEANLRDVINEKGIEFCVGENGAQLSGGQCQRIAIARALFANREILILDEGMSALDSRNAAEIVRNVLGQDNLTVIAVSHHVSAEEEKMYDMVFHISKNSDFVITPILEEI